MSLAGKVAVVTGASTGIGAAIARDLSAAGMNLVLTARNGDRLDDVRQSLPGEARTVPARIDDPDTAQRLLDAACKHFGRVDVLVNNAGMLAMGAVEDIDLDEVAAMSRVNFDAVVRSSYVFARTFAAQRHGTIVNVSSIAAFATRPAMGVYAALKGAVETFTNSLRVELAHRGVKVGYIAPGSTQTDMLADMRSSMGTASSDNPAVSPDNVASAVRFMLEQPAGVNIAGLRVYSATEKN